MVAYYHDRMPLALADDKIAAWLDLSQRSPLQDDLLLDLEFIHGAADGPRHEQCVRQKIWRRSTRTPKRPEQTSKLVRRRLDEVDERPQRRRHRRRPGWYRNGPEKRCHHGSRTGSSDAALEMRAKPVLEQIDDAGPGDRASDSEIDRPAGLTTAARSDRPAPPRPRVRTPRPASRRSGIGRAGRRCEQFARVLWSAVAIEIGRRAAAQNAAARPDRHRDHVLLQPLVVADAGVATARQHVDETLLDDHLHAMSG